MEREDWGMEAGYDTMALIKANEEFTDALLEYFLQGRVGSQHVCVDFEENTVEIYYGYA